MLEYFPMMIPFFALLFAGFANAFTYDDYTEVLRRKDAFDEKCKITFINEECNDERSRLRDKLSDLSEIPEIKLKIRTQMRLKAFDNAKAWCEKDGIVGKDQAMQFEIATLKPELEKHRLKLDRKKFCHCRTDRRLKLFGQEGAGSFYLYDDHLHLSPKLSGETTKEIRELDKEIFISCFEQIITLGYAAPPRDFEDKSSVPPVMLKENPDLLRDYSSDGKKLSFEERFRKVNESVLKDTLPLHTIFRFELNRVTTVLGSEITLVGFSQSPGKISALFKDSKGQSFEAFSQTDGKGGTFLHGFSIGDKPLQLIRLDPDRSVTFRIGR